MPRRKYKKNIAEDDLIYENTEVAKLVNYIMVDGKKSVARKIVYSTFERLKKKSLDPIDVLKQALNNVAPNYEVKPRRIGGASYLVPIETRPKRKLFLAANWIVQGAKQRSGKEYRSFQDKLFAELLDAYQNQGKAIEKRKQVEKLAEANKAFAHFRW